MLPPRIVRRLVFAPLLILITLAALVTLPVLLAIAALVSLALPGRWRAVRLLWFGVVWLTLESAALLTCLALWVISGFGGRLRSAAYLERHYALARWFLARVYGAATRTFRLRVEITEPPLTEEEAAARLARPVIVLSRHAGPGDSFLLVHQLISLYQRRPRVVLKAVLQLDPGIDVVLNRLPSAFVWPRRTLDTGIIDQIKRLAAGLGPTDALVIFPEGGDFTQVRRLRAIVRLEQRRRLEEAQRAQRMAYVMAPRPGGALAAIEAAPTADVIFVAHTGLEDLMSVGDIWRAIPMEQVIKARWWRVPVAEVPRDQDRDDQIRWLYDWWERIDTWIADNRPMPVADNRQQAPDDLLAAPEEARSSRDSKDSRG